MADEQKQAPETNGQETNNDNNNKAEAQQTAPQAKPEEASASPVSPLEQAQSQYNEIKDKYLRLAADYDNFRKRTQKERLELRDRYHLDVLEDLLPVLDNFDLALKSVPETVEAKKFAEGIVLVDKQLHEILSQYGLKEIEAIGKPFDPHYHEAVMTVENYDYPDQTVLEEIRKGYIKEDKVIRPSLVKVAINPAPVDE
jgi:molecular chaperone GrpE